jgi:adenylate cyclase
MLSIIFLLIIKDFQWLIQNIELKGVMFAQESVIKEVSYVIVLFLVLVGNIILSYSKNLRLYFEMETSILKKVSDGQLEHYVPVVTGDEFGLIASHTNQMIDGLREKDRIKQLFGKVVSPEIARRFLDQGEEHIKLGGTRQNLVFLFSDVRNFTTMTEENDPEVLVHRLNEYFTEMVSVILSQKGLIDKFIGDGIMAVFGLEDSNDAVNQSVRAAVDMQRAVDRLNQQPGLPIQIGIGIHSGDVIAGLMGSLDRLEFTFIGDAVNIASRLEGLTKNLGASILVSPSIYDRLSHDTTDLPWESFGEHPLNGKREAFPIFGIRRNSH